MSNKDAEQIAGVYLDAVESIITNTNLDEFLSEDVLEVVAHTRYSQIYGTIVDRVEFLLAYGGPTVRAYVAPETNRVTVEAHWGSQSADIDGTISDALSEWVCEYAATVERQTLVVK